jgi:branched-chain amino acid transport system permease protein
MRTVVEFVCFLVFAQMWNLLAGYGGMFSIGQQGFLGLGGYALFVLANHLHINPFVSILLGGIFAVLLAIPTARLVFRLQGGYFAIGTWVVSEVFRVVISNMSVLGGGSGQSLTAMARIPKATREAITFWIALALAVGSVALIYWLLRSRFGLALTAIRDNERASESQGVDVSSVKFRVYLMAAFGCGLVGALYYMNVLRIAPNSAFDIGWAASVIFIVVMGGIGTIEGPIVGTLLFFGLRQLLSDYGTWYLIVLGLIAVIAMLVWPKGIWGYVQQRFDLRFFPVQHRVQIKNPKEKP